MNKNIYLFSRHHFTPMQVQTMTREDAARLAEMSRTAEDDNVVEYCYASEAFKADWNYGSIEPQDYYITFL